MAAAVRLQGETGVQAIAPIKPIHYRQVAASADQDGGKRRAGSTTVQRASEFSRDDNGSRKDKRQPAIAQDANHPVAYKECRAPLESRMSIERDVPPDRGNTARWRKE